MATAETAPRLHDRHTRRRPFSNWMKRLANLKSSSATSGGPSAKKPHDTAYDKGKKNLPLKNNPYPISGQAILPSVNTNGHLTPPSGRSISFASPTTSRASLSISADGRRAPTIGNKSMAATVSTNGDAAPSEAGHSKTGTVATNGGAVGSMGMGGGEGSTFSSPAPSVKSITTTLTTMQSAAPSTLLGGAPMPSSAPLQSQGSLSHTSTSAPTQNTQTLPNSPVSALPPHMSHLGHTNHPITYTAATANNLWTDNASVVTLASSSKRRRRNSLDTNASVRALAPSSLYGGSKESLPLSILSASLNEQPGTTNQHPARAVSVNLANAERASVYSSSGTAHALPSERNSYHASRGIQGDGGSVRSGLLGHSRNDSITRSISSHAATETPVASPREGVASIKASPRISGRRD